MIEAKDYLDAVEQALSIALGQTNLYDGEDGALRIAREIGACLADYPEKERIDALQISYDVCVKAYNLSPPIDKKDWDDAVRQGIKKALEGEE